MWIPQCFASSTLCPGKEAPCVCSLVSVQSRTLLYLLDQSPGGGIPCMQLQCLPLSAGSSCKMGTWGLHISQRSWMELLPTVHIWGKCKQQHSVVPPVLGCFLSSLRAVVVPQPSPCGHFFLLYRCFSIGSQHAFQLAHSCLSRGMALHIGVYMLCTWKSWASSASTYTSVLGPPLRLESFFLHCIY